MWDNVNLILIISIKCIKLVFQKEMMKIRRLKISENCPFKWRAPFLPDNDAGLDV